MKNKTTKILLIIILLLAVVTGVLVWEAFGTETTPDAPADSAAETTESTEAAETTETTEPVPEASVPLVDPADIIETDIPEGVVIINTDDMEPIQVTTPVIDAISASVEDVTGKIITGVPQDIYTAPFMAEFTNLTENGVDADISVRLAFKWDDLKAVQPGDAIQTVEALILVEEVFGSEITGSEDLIAINDGEYYLQRSPGGYWMNEDDGVLIHHLYYPALINVQQHIEFDSKTEFGFVNRLLTKQEFVDTLAGRDFKGMIHIENNSVYINIFEESDVH